MLQVAVVGLGRMGRIHLTNACLHPLIEVVAACSPKKEDLNWLEVAHPKVTKSTSLEELLSTFTSIDAVFLVTPSALHVTQIRLCLEYGAHVFCEKPLAIDHKGCLDLEDLQKTQKNRQLMVGFMRRFDPSYIKMHQVLRSGDIGAPILFRSYSADADHEIAGYLEYASHSGGHFLDMSIHDIDLMHWLVDGTPNRVMTSGGAFKYPDLEKYGGDNAAAMIELDTGIIALLYTGRTAAHGYLVETEIIGTEGTLRVGSGPDANLLEVLSSKGHQKTYSQDFTERFASAFRNELDYFVKCLDAGVEVDPSWSAGIRATRTALTLESNYSQIKNHLS